MAVVLRDGRFSAAGVHDSVAHAVSAHPEVAYWGVDMPIGLLDHGDRDCERLARMLVGPRRSSVFVTPPRAAVEAPDYDTARRECIARTGHSLSKQAWNLAPRILEIDRFCRDDPAAAKQLHETFPEAAFVAMAGGVLAAPKRTWHGLELRRRLLAEHGVTVPVDIGAAGAAAPDDVLDAAAAAWTAHRIDRGDAVCLPDPPQRGPNGEPVAIWY